MQCWKIAPLFLIFIILSTNARNVNACGGGGGRLEDDIAYADVIVRARVVESDDVYQNSIVEVESYLKGGPRGNYLLVVQNDPTLTRAIIEWWGFAKDCAWFASPLPAGQSIYLFLNRQVEGSYLLSGGSISEVYYYFPTSDAMVSEYVNDGEIDLTESEFVAFIAENTGETPVAPTISDQYPPLAPLKITTATGNEYFLPIDDQPPSALTWELEHEILWGGGWLAPNVVEGCTVGDCVTFSPAGVSVAMQLTADTIMLDYYLPSIVGQAFLYSSTDDTLAVWNQNQIDLYLLDSWALRFEGSTPFELLDSVNINVDDSDTEFRGIGVWSPDGRQLAYSDRDGLWLWDVFSVASTPRLLVATSVDDGGESIYPRYFSAQGRYLAIGQETTLATIDLVTGEQLPDGIVSPNERFLLAYDTSAELAPLSECQLAPYECRDTEYTIRQAQWLNDFSYMVVICTTLELDTCNSHIDGIGNWMRYTALQLNPLSVNWLDDLRDQAGYAFAYEAVGHSLAIVNSPRSITMNGQAYDLSEYLDSEIVDIDWMRLLFYLE